MNYFAPIASGLAVGLIMAIAIGTIETRHGRHSAPCYKIADVIQIAGRCK